jgi:hypothetical protein
VNIRFSRERSEDASVLMIALILGGILGVALASYLFLVRGHYASVNRSQSWNAALALAEAGTEEALAGLNPGAGSPPPALSGHGWELKQGTYRLPQESRRLTNGCSYGVVITNEPGRGVSTNYVIYSTGYAAVPGSSTPVSRSLRVAITNVPLFTAAVAVKSNLTMVAAHDRSVFADSFDSQDARHSDRGFYPSDPGKTATNGDVACLSGALMIGTDAIHGDLLLGPLTRVGPNEVAGKVSRDLNVDFPDVQPPFSTAVPPIGGKANGKDYTYLLSDGNYMVNSGTLKGTILVTGVAVLYVTEGAMVNFALSDSITITANASLKLYVASPSVTLPNVINGGLANQFEYFGLPSNIRMTQQIEGAFVGSIYAPHAELTINVGGAGGRGNFIGACTVGSLTIKNPCSFHFDENLVRAGSPARGYVVSSWREL